jgi:uncharacterized protein (TIGR00288 family)
MTTNASAERQIAVLIDFENVGLGSIQWLFDQVSDIGRITVKRAYADWADQRNKAAGDQLLQLGIEPIHRPPSAAAGKNSSDIRLVIDAVELAYQSPVDTFVIASSDSDFAPLVSKLRAAGKVVFGAGRREATSRTLVISCDRYLYLEQDQSQPRRARPGRPPKRQQQQQQPINDLLARAVKASIDEHGKVVGSRLHQTIQRLDPGFNFRAMGHSTFTKYLEASPEVKVTRPRGAGDVTVELADQALPTQTPTTQPAPTQDEPTQAPMTRAPTTQAEPAQPAPTEAPTTQALPTQPEPTQPAPTQAEEPVDADADVWARVDDIWQVRAGEPGGRIPGQRAASDAAQALSVQNLKSSPYKTLQRLLDTSEFLRARWSREGNVIIRL